MHTSLEKLARGSNAGTLQHEFALLLLVHTIIDWAYQENSSSIRLLELDSPEYRNTIAHSERLWSSLSVNAKVTLLCIV
jgi:hypothetical protein